MRLEIRLFAFNYRRKKLLKISLVVINDFDMFYLLKTVDSKLLIILGFIICDIKKCGE